LPVVLVALETKKLIAVRDGADGPSPSPHPAATMIVRTMKERRMEPSSANGQ
jgi:hypothetical protein